MVRIERRVLNTIGQLTMQRFELPGPKRFDRRAGQAMVRHYEPLVRGQREVEVINPFGKATTHMLRTFWDPDCGLSLSLSRMDGDEDQMAGTIFDRHLDNPAIDAELRRNLIAFRAMYNNFRQAFWLLELVVSADFSQVHSFVFQHSFAEDPAEKLFDISNLTVGQFRLEYLLPRTEEDAGYRVLCDAFVQDTIERLSLPFLLRSGLLQFLLGRSIADGLSAAL